MTNHVCGPACVTQRTLPIISVQVCCSRWQLPSRGAPMQNPVKKKSFWPHRWPHGRSSYFKGIQSELWHVALLAEAGPGQDAQKVGGAVPGLFLLVPVVLSMTVILFRPRHCSESRRPVPMVVAGSCIGAPLARGPSAELGGWWWLRYIHMDPRDTPPLSSLPHPGVCVTAHHVLRRGRPRSPCTQKPLPPLTLLRCRMQAPH